jgi:uncharacterized coiled-coil protein SlyX
MKYLIFLAASAIAFMGCTRTAELEEQNKSIQRQNQELTQNLSAQDAYIDSIIASIDEIHRSIESAHAKEKNLLTETKGFESDKTLTKDEVRSGLLTRIDAINEVLKTNAEKIAALEKKAAQHRKQYASLNAMVENLKKTVTEREQSIAALETKVKNLEGEISQKAALITERDAVIDQKEKEIATVYYVVGTREELEAKGIIKDEGGFLWGLVGSTTTLASGFDPATFTPIDRYHRESFRVDGEIKEIVPRRDEKFYRAESMEGAESILTVADRDHFWQDKYLVILVD